MSGAVGLQVAPEIGQETMRQANPFFPLFLLLSLLFSAGPLASAELAKGEDGFYVTGAATRTKRVLFMTVEVYRATHAMKEIPDPTTTDAVAEANVDKKMTIRFLRNVDLQKIIDGIKEGYRRNGWNEMEKVEELFSILKGDLRKNDVFSVEYQAENETLIAIGGDGRTSSVAGRDFMVATWSAWFKKIDSPGFSERLIANLKSRSGSETKQ